MVSRLERSFCLILNNFKKNIARTRKPADPPPPVSPCSFRFTKGEKLDFYSGRSASAPGGKCSGTSRRATPIRLLAIP